MEPSVELRAVDSHARPIAGPTSEQRPAITPHPPTRLSSRPPPLPPEPHDLAPLARISSPDDVEPTPLPLNGDDDEEDELTPVSVTKPSLPFDHAAAGLLPPLPPAPVVMLASNNVALAGNNVEVFDALLSPLPPPALIVEAPPGYHSPTDDAPVSSGPISGPVSSIAPPMPQIPKPVSSSRPPVQAPGIVATQAIPLIVPAKKQGQSPLFVMFAAAIIGGMIALAVGLSMRGKPREDASASEAPATSSAASIATAPLPNAPAPTAAPNAPASASATSIATATPLAPNPADAAPTAPAQPGHAASAKPTGSAPVAPIARPGRKTDRIED
ncbi:MAG: hypothetical protein U0441_28105 [Polyangiaceae bacterium]